MRERESESANNEFPFLNLVLLMVLPEVRGELIGLIVRGEIKCFGWF
jgi:hypothetical protein